MERRNEDKNKDKNKDKEKRTLLQSFCLRRMDKFLKNLIGEKQLHLPKSFFDVNGLWNDFKHFLPIIPIIVYTVVHNMETQSICIYIYNHAQLTNAMSKSKET